MAHVKPYHSVPIRECGESLVCLTPGPLALANPHPYVALGAPYHSGSPWFLRRSIAESLFNAQQMLNDRRPGWKILLTDALRPNAVQAFLVNREFAIRAEEMGFDAQKLTPEQQEKVWAAVFQFWGIPSDNPQTPSPHSTGAAFDCTLVDEKGQEVDMGTPVDELTERALPDYFMDATDEAGRRAQANRVLLRDVLRAQGFVQHKKEWWHFSRGDQLAVWSAEPDNAKAFAIYGRKES